jgi:hypothetical protein
LVIRLEDSVLVEWSREPLLSIPAAKHANTLLSKVEQPGLRGSTTSRNFVVLDRTGAVPRQVQRGKLALRRALLSDSRASAGYAVYPRPISGRVVLLRTRLGAT